MADIIDPNESDINDDELQEFDSPSETENQATAEPEDDLPEKFKGKSAKDIAKAYEEVEKLASRHAQEVGELRKLTDQILKNQLEATRKPEPQAQELDFFDDPEKSVAKVVESHPAVKEAQRTAALLRAQQVKASLEAKHGKVEDFAQDPDFIEYVKASPVRMRLMQAAENYDFEAADELLTTYKEIKQVKAKQAEQQTDEIKQGRDKTLKAASVPMGSGTGESSKKVYRRADLIRLMQTDRDRYNAMQDEIMAAYQEGRVK